MDRRVDPGIVLTHAFGIYAAQARTLIPAAFLLYLAGSILSGIGGVLGPVGLIANLVAAALLTGMVVRLVEDLQDGRRDASTWWLLRSVAPKILPLMAAGLVFGIPVGIGLLLVIPGVLLWTVWAVYAPAIVVEDANVLGSLGRSRDLVRGSFAPVFSVVAVVFLTTELVPVIVIYILAANVGLGVSAVVALVASALLAPIGALASAILYFDLRDAA